MEERAWPDSRKESTRVRKKQRKHKKKEKEKGTEAKKIKGDTSI